MYKTECLLSYYVIIGSYKLFLYTISESALFYTRTRLYGKFDSNCVHDIHIKKKSFLFLKNSYGYDRRRVSKQLTLNVMRCSKR